MQMSGSGYNKEENEPHHVRNRSYTYIGISKKSHSKAESILNWLKKSTKYKNLQHLWSKKISNDQELIQSDPTSCPQNQKGNN